MDESTLQGLCMKRSVKVMRPFESYRSLHCQLEVLDRGISPNVAWFSCLVERSRCLHACIVLEIIALWVKINVSDVGMRGKNPLFRA